MGRELPLTERELVEKLVVKGHLNVPERRQLPAGLAKASLVREAILGKLWSTGWFPPDWRPEMQYHGGLIERLAGGACRLHWKYEIGIERYGSHTEQFPSAAAAAEAWLRHTYGGDDIDGVPIDWTA